MLRRNLLLALSLSSSLMVACGPEETAPSQSGLAAIEERLGRIESQLESPSGAASVSGSAVTAVAVQPPAFALAVGATQKIELITLTTESEDTSVITGFNVVDFAMEDDSIATVNAKGEITGVAAGTTILEVELGAAKKSLPVVVTGSAPSPTPNPAATATPAPAATATPAPTPTPESTALPSTNIKAVSISPDTMELEPGETGLIAKIFVTLADDNIGSLNDIELAEFRSANTSIATISDNGVVTAVNEGTTTITATYKGIEGTLTVTVSDDG